MKAVVVTLLKIALSGREAALIHGIRSDKPPSAKPDRVSCACGDEFAVGSYGHGYLDAAGVCTNCDITKMSGETP